MIYFQYHTFLNLNLINKELITINKYVHTSINRNIYNNLNKIT